MKKFMALTLAVMTVLSTVSFAAPQMADTVIGATEIYDDATPALPDEDNAEVQNEATLSADTSDCGTLIARVDFDDVEAGTTVTKSDIQTKAANWIEKNLPEGFPSIYLNMTGNNDSKITVTADDDGNGNHAVWENSACGWPKFGFWTNSGDLMPEGKYTFKLDFHWISYKDNDDQEVSDSDIKYLSVTYTPNNPDGTWTTGERNVAGRIDGSNTKTLSTLAQTRGFITGKNLQEQNYYKAYTDAGSTAADKGLYSFTGLGKIACYWDTSDSYKTASAYIDNIELYYEAPSTKVVVENGNGNVIDTVKLFGGKTTNNICFIQSSFATIDLTQYESSVDKTDTTKLFSGWKNKATGETVSSTYTATADALVTIVPEYSVESTEYGFKAKNLTNLTQYQNDVIGTDHYGDYAGTKNGGYANLEKPANITDGNTVVTVGTVTNTELIELDDGEKAVRYTLDVPKNTRTDLNIYLASQINSDKLLATSKIKGISYTFRLLGPDGEPADSKYFTTNGHISTGAYFKTNTYFDDANPCGWHWDECVHVTKYLAYKGNEYNGEWLTAYLDLENFNYTSGTHNGKNWADAFVCSDLRLRIANELLTNGDDGFVLDIKSIDFIEDADYVESEYVSHDFYDLRKGYFDVKVSKKYEISKAGELALAMNVSGIDVAHIDEIENADGTCTYRVYAKYDLNGKTVTVKLLDGNTLTHTYTLDEVNNKADGENLIPNGDFSNPYYVPLSRNKTNTDYVNGSAFNAKLTVDGLVITLTNPSEWCTTSFSNVKFKPNTNYYFAMDAAFTGDSEDTDGNKHHETGTTTEQVTLYVPVLDGRFDINVGTNDQYNNGQKVLSYIPSTKENFKINLNSETFGKDNTQSFAKVLSIYDTDYYTSDSCSMGTYKDKTALASDLFNNPTLSLQLCTTNGKKAGFYTKEANGTMTNAAGLQYTIKNFVIKEMFPVTLKYGDATLDTLYAAKDVEITLPTDASNIGGAFLTGWSDGNTTYAPGASYTLTNAGAVTLSAVTSFAPKTQNEISVRTDSYTGIRFKAAVKQAIKSNTATTEIGYIVTRKVSLTAENINSNNFTADSAVTKVTGKAYVKAENINKVFASDDTLKLDYFTAVVYNIPTNQYDDILVARPYVTVDSNTYYGDAMEMSLRQAATAVKNSEGYVENDVIESIVGSSN